MHHHIEEIIHGKHYSGLLTQLTFSQEEVQSLTWFKDGHEFRYRDEMYDVVRTIITDQCDVIYHCIKDEKESELYKDIERDLASSDNTSGGRNFALQLFNFLSHMYFTTPDTDHIVMCDPPQKPRTSLDFFPVVYGKVACEPPDVA